MCQIISTSCTVCDFAMGEELQLCSDGKIGQICVHPSAVDIPTGTLVVRPKITRSMNIYLDLIKVVRYVQNKGTCASCKRDGRRVSRCS